MNSRGGTCVAQLQGSRLTIVMTGESLVNSLVLAYAFLTPLLVIPVAGLLGASDLLFLPAIALTVLVGRVRQCTVAHLLLALFLFLVGVSLFGTRDFTYVLKWGRLIGITFPFFLAAFSTVTLPQVIRVFFWSGLVAILMGIGLWWFDVAVFAEEANQRIWIEGSQSRVRASGLFGNSGSYGALIAMWTATCGIFILNEQSHKRTALAAVVLTAVLALVGSSSRVALCGILAGAGTGMLVMLSAHVRRRGLRLNGRTMSFFVISIAITLATLFIIVPQVMNQQWLDVTYARFDPRAHHSTDDFLTGRLTIWQQYQDSIGTWGIFGVGYKQGHLHFASSPHNQFLCLAAETGFLSLLVFCLFLGNIGLNAFSQLRTKSFEAMICLVVLAAFVTDSMGGEPLGSWQITPLTMILLGICIRSFKHVPK